MCNAITVEFKQTDVKPNLSTVGVSKFIGNCFARSLDLRPSRDIISLTKKN
ncbi:MAG: hypothetical protein O4804_00565 [Trichodesmium sp. St11_bin5]|nr:hypothetical protein [Trichodesmium sp. St11_bin5]